MTTETENSTTLAELLVSKRAKRAFLTHRGNAKARGTVIAAARAAGVEGITIRRWCRSGRLGWRFADAA